MGTNPAHYKRKARKKPTTHIGTALMTSNNGINSREDRNRSAHNPAIQADQPIWPAAWLQPACRIKLLPGFEPNTLIDKAIIPCVA